MEEDLVKRLTDFGLSVNQAKVYLSIVQSASTSVNRISKATKLYRQDIYRIMPTLEKRSGRKNNNYTNHVPSHPLKEGLPILLQHRTEEYAEIQKKTRSLLNNIQENNVRTALQEEDSQFIITSEKTLFRKKLEEDIQMAQTNIDMVVFPLEAFKEMLFYHLPHFKRAMRKGVKI